VRLLGRAFLFAFTLCLAVPVGLAVFSIGSVFEPAIQELVVGLTRAGFDAAFSELSPAELGELAQQLVVGLWALAMALFLLPPALVGAVGEVLGLRSIVWYGVGCGVLTAALPWLSRGSLRAVKSAALAAESRITLLLFVTGAATGLIYWLVAGRTAGVSAPASPGSWPRRR
jgi:hypothetical protein